MTQILTEIITWLLTLLAFYIGYVIGIKARSENPLDFKIPKIRKKKRKLGAVPKLSVTELEKKGTRLEETEKAMEETLDEIL